MMISAQDLTRTWGAQFQPLVCETCDWVYLASGETPPRCPHCFSAALEPFSSGLEHLASLEPPEIVVPFAVDQSTITAALADFVKGIPFRPADLTPENLKQRLTRLYWPMWLLDADVQATWQGEFGFGYQVKSDVSSYGSGGWSSQEVLETRQDWEPRLGTIQRRMHNVPAPALEDHRDVIRHTRNYEQSKGTAFEAGLVRHTLIRLPGRSSDDALQDAVIALERRAAADCRQAVEADDVRSFKWKFRSANPHWTQMLLPAYTTFYTDDEGRARVLWINGQQGSVSGARRSSVKSARRWLILGAVAAVLCVIGVMLALGDNSARLIVALGIAAMVFLLSAAPMLIAMQFNDREQKAEVGQAR